MRRLDGVWDIINTQNNSSFSFNNLPLLVQGVQNVFKFTINYICSNIYNESLEDISSRGVDHSPTSLSSDSLAKPRNTDPLLSLENGASTVLTESIIHNTIFSHVSEECSGIFDRLDKNIRFSEGSSPSVFRYFTI